MRFFLSVFCVSCVFHFPGFAAAEVVQTGETRTTPINLVNTGDSALVQEGGLLETTAIAITLSNDAQTAQNEGVISTSGATGYGIYADHNQANILNKGNIYILSSLSSGIVLMGSSLSTVTNEGLISTLGEQSPGISIINSSQNTIKSSGQIFTAGSNAYGINLSNSSQNTIIESGSITTTGTNAYGIAILSNSDDNELAFTGTIQTTGAGSHGIMVASASDRTSLDLTNGMINVADTYAAALFLSGGSDHTVRVENSTLTAPQQVIAVYSPNARLSLENRAAVRATSAGGTALLFVGTNPTLSTSRSTLIVGKIEASQPVNVTVQTGANIKYTFDSPTYESTDSLGAGLYESLNISAPYVQVGQELLVVDPTPFLMQVDMTQDVADGILDPVFLSRRQACSCSLPCETCGFWGAGLGSYRLRRKNEDYVRYNNWQGGFILGFDKPVCGGQGGAFGGISFGKGKVEWEAETLKAAHYFGGFSYETTFCQTLFGVALTAGYADWQSCRTIMNNLATDGIEYARADFSGGLVAGDLMLARSFCFWKCRPCFSFDLRYAGLFLGNWNEHGSGANHNVKDRQIDLLTTRFECTLPWVRKCSRSDWRLEPYLGVLGRYQVGGTQINSLLGGQSLTFTQAGPHNLAAFLIGARGNQSYGCFSLFFNVEGSFDSQKSYRVIGDLGIGKSF